MSAPLATQRCLRIEVPLNLTDTRANVFSFPQLVSKRTAKLKKPNGTPISVDTEEGTDEGQWEDEGAKGEGSESDNEISSDEDEPKDEQGDQAVKKRRTRTDPTNIYDIEDDFIDDSEMLDPEMGDAPAVWEYGYFAWKGSVENFHEDVTFQDFFEPARAPAPKKKRVALPKSTSTAASKKSTDVSPSKPSSLTPGPSSIAAAAAGGQTEPADAVTASEKKRKRVASSTGTPVKKSAAAGVVLVAGESAPVGTDSADIPKKKKRVGTGVPATNTTAAATPAPAVTSTTAEAPSDDKGKKKGLVPLSPAVEVTLNYLKNEREKESFENKKTFPQNLRPPLLEASKTAVLHSEFNENFIRYIKKILPYNSFTLKKLTGRMLLGHAVMQSQIALNLKIGAFEAHVKELCAQQGIDGPQPHEPSTPTTTAAPAIPESIASLTTVPDKKKFKFDEEAKLSIWNLLVLEWEQAMLTNLLNSLDGNDSGVKVTEANVRKSVYAKLVTFWPQGWMTTTDLSREYTLYKRRINSRAQTAGLQNLDLSSLYIESVAKMLDPDTREVFAILKATKAMFDVPAPVVVKAEGVKVEGGGGGEKKEGGGEEGAGVALGAAEAVEDKAP
ncbi:hypothetical protein HDU98_006137 [Podochytrium sp. JEL0797]|nr:hypothetical protein HDU98_006137 [Podochytrium sp. JEL0797]